MDLLVITVEILINSLDLTAGVSLLDKCYRMDFLVKLYIYILRINDK